MAATVSDERVTTLASGLSGQVLTPEDERYGEARRVHNGLIDKRPALIVQPLGTADIVAAVEFARENGLELSVRGGGHNVGGRAVTEGGLMVDLSSMRGVYVDPIAQSARAQGGAIWREFNREAAVHGLATTGGLISTTGVGGYTLGGGLGWLMGKHGLAVDNLLSVELVTADGEVLNVDADAHPDLFWALRGGGGNFGVAASLEFRLHRQSQVYGGLIAHPVAAARDMLRFYRDLTAEAPDALTIFAGLVHAPDGSGLPLAALILCHSGEPARAEEEARPLLEFGEPLMTEVAHLPYPAINLLLDDAYPKGALNYWKSSFVTELSDELIDTMIEGFEQCPSPMSAILLEHFHGTVSRVGVSDTAVPNRGPGYNLLIPSEWVDPEQTEANIAWGRATFDALSSFFASKRWLNYYDEDDANAEALAAAYGPNYERLREVKRRYDPTNLFRLNQNITPS